MHTITKADRPGTVWARVAVACLLALVAAGLRAQATPEPLPSAEVWTNGEVRVIHRDAAGGIIVGGRFERVSGEPRLNLARLLADGSVDPSWRADINGRVQAIAVDAEGRIYVGGSFDRVAGVSRRDLVRLSPAGAVDATFNAYVSTGVDTLAVGPDARLYVGGGFGSITLPSGSVDIGYLVRYSADGTLDQAFDLDLNDRVRHVAFSGSYLYLAGGFSTVSGAERTLLARVDRESGAIDAAFRPEPNSNTISALNTDSLGRVYVSGNFTTIAGAARRRIARFLADGRLDAAYAPQGIAQTPSAPVAFDALDRAYVAARFDATPGAANLLVRLLPDGAPDPTFDPRPSEGPRALAIGASGEVLVAGPFFAIGGAGFEQFAGLARLDDAGAFRGGAIIESRGRVSFLEKTLAGIVVGGNFRRLGAAPRANLARLTANGEVDAGFRADTDGPITSLAGTPNGALYVSGAFMRAGGVARRRVARLSPDGAVDPGFDPGAADPLDAMYVAPSGRLYVAGSPEVGGQKGTVLRLAPDGTVDPLWLPLVSGLVFAFAELPGGEVVVGGGFSAIGGEPRRHLAKLDPVNAEVIRPWQPRLDGQVLTLLAEPGGDLFVGGEFSRFNDAPSARLLRLRTAGSGEAVPGFAGGTSNVVYLVRAVDGKLLVNERSRLQTFLADPVTGSVHGGWRIVANDAIRAHAIGDGGDLFIGGDFQFIGDQQRLGLARVRFESVFGNGFDPLR